MRRRWALAVLSLIIVALVAVGFLTWNRRADDICREQAPRGTSGYSMAWEWGEFAYVCDYRAPVERTKRVGITEVFPHPGPRRRHGSS